MGQKKKVVEVELDENGKAVLKQIEAIAGDIRETLICLKDETDALKEGAKRGLDTVCQLEGKLRSGLMNDIRTAGQEAASVIELMQEAKVIAQVTEKHTDGLLIELGQLMYITEMQVFQLNKTVEDKLLPLVLLIMARGAGNGGDGDSGNILGTIKNAVDIIKDIRSLSKGAKIGTVLPGMIESGAELAGETGLAAEMATGAEIGEAGGPWGMAAGTTLALLIHFLSSEPHIMPTPTDKEGNELIGSSGRPFDNRTTVKDQLADIRKPLHQEFKDGKPVYSNDDDTPQYDPKLIDSFLHINLNNPDGLPKPIFEASLSKWLAAHPKEQEAEMEKDYSPQKLLTLKNKLKKDFGYNSIDEALTDDSQVFSFYSDSLHQRPLKEGEQEEIKKHNKEKHKEEFENTQKDLLVNPTIPNGMASRFDNINPYSVSSPPQGNTQSYGSMGGGGTSATPAINMPPTTSNVTNNISAAPVAASGGSAGQSSMPAMQASGTVALPSANAVGATKAGGKGGVASININYQSHDIHNANSQGGKNDIHAEVLKVLTDSVSDSKVGADVH